MKLIAAAVPEVRIGLEKEAGIVTFSLQFGLSAIHEKWAAPPVN